VAHILLVDDNSQERSLTRRVLEDQGHTVSEVADGHAAELADSDRPADVLILDVHMPRRDGLETLRSFRKRGRPAKIIMTGGVCMRCQVDFLPIAQRLGADATLRKPLEREALLCAVALVLGVANTG
jgi:CheY-like chemotaxis protein